MNLKLDFNEALKLASILDEVIASNIFEMTSDNFQTSVVCVYNRLVDGIRDELNKSEG